MTDRAGLSLALGAFVAGMLISETEFRYQVEEDIKPFRDVLLGLFFVTIGMRLDLHEVWSHAGWVLTVLVAVMAAKALLIAALSRVYGSEVGTALRTGFSLSGAGEFGLVLLALAEAGGVLDRQIAQISLAVLILSMLLSPFVVERGDRLVRRFASSEWMQRAMTLHNIAIQTMSAESHVIICGYGRSGQNLARFLQTESIPFIALDLDPRRVKDAAAAGESVVFGDAARREVLVAAGLLRARALVVSYADAVSALKILALVRELRPGLPVVVRTLDDVDIDRLREAGAAEVVAEILEGSLMLATHAMMLCGVPLNRVLKHIRDTREAALQPVPGLFPGCVRFAGRSADGPAAFGAHCARRGGHRSDLVRCGSVPAGCGGDGHSPSQRAQWPARARNRSRRRRRDGPARHHGAVGGGGHVPVAGFP